MYNPLTIARDGSHCRLKTRDCRTGYASINTIGVPLLRAQGYYPVTGKPIAKIMGSLVEAGTEPMNWTKVASIVRVSTAATVMPKFTLRWGP